MSVADVFILAVFLGVCVSVWHAFKPEDGGFSTRGRMMDGIFGMFRRRPAKRAPSDARDAESVEEKALRLARLDRSFEPQQFMEDVKKGFETVLCAFEKKARAELRPLVSDRVFAAFDRDMRELEKKGESLETEIIRFKKIFIRDVSAGRSRAEVTVVFTTEQTTLVKDAKGRVLRGDANQIGTVTDVWRFSKDLKRRRPMWILDATVKADA
ncbi:MAG: Tim44/TimA family putative adaptor protein [Rickettsiales bacterium]|jgi:predicted lipid-binding transport protein (Tim44 family)|nr:Tim44/TimA family putative adaptor protein [Rickettsiales bacterium]